MQKNETQKPSVSTRSSFNSILNTFNPSYFSHFFSLSVNFLNGNSQFIWTALLPFTIPLLSWIITGKSIAICLVMYIWIIVIASIHFGIVGLNAAHHHPDIFHDGDATR